MQRVYKCLPVKEFTNGIYKLIPIRDEDKYAIMKWRNEQIDILRQKELLTLNGQESYFRNVVDKLFEEEKPTQLLFSFFEGESLIGYGGLVHIDWESGSGEISFITETSRTSDKNQFINDWKNYLNIVRVVAKDYLRFFKVYTYAYDVRPELFVALTESNFIQEARLKKHILVKNRLQDILIHSLFLPDISLRRAESSDLMTYFNWANDRAVRGNSFNQDLIPLESHTSWFNSKIQSERSIMFIAFMKDSPMGQIRFDEVELGIFEIDFSIAEDFRGMAIGNKLLTAGCKKLAQERPDCKRIVGQVKSSNTASIRSFINSGFSRSSEPEKSEIETYFINIHKNL
jgi:RimJ/RimL family protein N-acetyltransferase